MVRLASRSWGLFLHRKKAPCWIIAFIFLSMAMTRSTHNRYGNGTQDEHVATTCEYTVVHYNWNFRLPFRLHEDLGLWERQSCFAWRHALRVCARKRVLRLSLNIRWHFQRSHTDPQVSRLTSWRATSQNVLMTSRLEQNFNLHEKLAIRIDISFRSHRFVRLDSTNTKRDRERIHCWKKTRHKSNLKTIRCSENNW